MRLALLLVLATAACDRAPRGERATFQARDSAGVRIAESSAPLWGDSAAWSIAQQPHLDIGREGERGHDLDDVVAALRLSDGRIAVADGGHHEIRIFDAQGALLGSIGRRGEGPGEFSSLDEMWLLPGDSLLTVDARLRRLTVFRVDGELERTARLSEPAGTRASTPFLLLHDRTLLARPGFMFGANTQPGAYRDTARIVRYSIDGPFVDSVGRFPQREMFVHAEGSNTLAGEMPFGKRTDYAAAPDGFFVGAADAFDIELRAANGELRSIIRAARANRAVGAEDVARLKTPEPGSSPEDQAFWRRVLDALQLPTQFPAYAALAADDNGYLWVREYVYPPDSAAPTWQIFDDAGRWLGGLVLPARFSITQISGAEVVGVWRDELDVQHVQAYRVLRR